MRNLYLLLALFFVAILQAQNPAALDLTFNYKSNKPFLDGVITKSYVQPDGKIIVWGTFNGYYIGGRAVDNTSRQYVNCKKLIRLNSDLTVDESFKFGENFSGNIDGVGVQSTGKIVISVTINSFYNGVLLPTTIFRLNSDGTLDATFITHTNGGMTNVFVTADDKILYRQDNTYTKRLNSNGSFDNSYNTSSTANISYIHPDGRTTLVQSGSISSYNSNGNYVQFDNQAFVNCNIYCVTMQSDGKVLIGGEFNSYNQSTTTALQMLRMNSDGSVDNTFTSLGFDPNNTYNVSQSNLYCQSSKVNVIEIQPDGKILVAGEFSSYGNTQTKKLVRLNADGSLDPTFNLISNFSYSVASLKVLPDGSILVGTHNYNAAGITIPLYNDFEVSNFFKIDGNGNLLNEDKNVNCSVVNITKHNNNILLFGERRSQYHRGIKQIDNNGTMIFNTNLRDAFNKFFVDLNDTSAITGVVQPDGKIIVAGAFDTYNGVPAKKLIRLNSDFSIDPTFNIGTGFTRSQTSSFSVFEIALQSNGKIIVSGDFQSFNGQNFPGGVVRLNTDGTLDTSFIYTGTYPMYSIKIMSDGKILAKHVVPSRILKYNSDGSVDSSFTPIPSGIFSDFNLQSTGKIICDNKRYNPDGSIDNSFHVAYFRPNGFSINALEIQSDDKILIGGQFTKVDDVIVSNLARLNADGTLDEAFDTGAGFDEAVNSIFIDSNGKILIGGDFTKYNGAFCTGIVRLVGGDAFLIKGKNKFDSDNNGCDASDIDFPNMKFTITTGLNTESIIPNITGDYSVTVAPGTYTITPIPASSNFNVSPANFTVTFPTQTSPFVQDFCLTSIGNHPDLEVTILPLTAARPGFDAKYKIIYKNKGNQLHSGSVTLNFNDAAIDLMNATPSASSQTTNNLTWNYTNLLPLEKREILLTFNLNTPTETPPLNSGSILNYTTTITSSLSDETPNDNTFAFHQNVVNSFDPNDKTCLEGATIGFNEIGNYVHYMIRFENKGTYNAQNISVKDLIDTSKFDINTLTPINGSHLFVTRITEGNKVEFYFEDINLPFADATNDGYVAFKIKTKATLVGGDTFSNSAAIYFDYNSAVDTNTATTTIQALAVQDFAFEQYFTVYPNPANNLLNIDKKENIAISSLSIFNILGQQVMTIPNAQSTSTIDVSSLKTGNYFLKINSSKGVSNTKFIKL
jgi:uncharacterized delta-60 repeat protein